MPQTVPSSVHGGYLPQLDGLRAWACTIVMLSHFFPARDYPLTLWTAPGGTGVRLFFVLSGFLITGILLRGRDRVAAAESSNPRLLGMFYARRFLRIFPLFYAVVFLLWVIDYGLMRDALLWHVTYLMNFWRVAEEIHFINHFWSLAVEEHFYLVWPMVVLCVPRRWLATVMVSFIVAAQAYRLGAWMLGAGFAHINIITFANLDTLSMGGLLALAMHGPQPQADRALRWAMAGLVIGTITTTALCVARGTGLINEAQRAVWHSLTLGLAFSGVIALAARGALPGARWWLQPFTYVGKISYGLYVLHPLVWEGLDWLEHRGTLPLPASIWLRLPIYFTAALLAAMISWHAYEYPLNRLKRFFPYLRKETEDT